MKALLLIVPLLGLSLYFTDLESESAISALVLPIMDLLLFLALMLWLTAKIGHIRLSQGSDSGVGGGFFDGDGGGCD